MKKVLTLVLALVLVLGLFSGCKPAGNGGENVLKVAAIETAYGSEMWQKGLRCIYPADRHPGAVNH